MMMRFYRGPILCPSKSIPGAGIFHWPLAKPANRKRKLGKFMSWYTEGSWYTKRFTYPKKSLLYVCYVGNVYLNKHFWNILSKEKIDGHGLIPCQFILSRNAFNMLKSGIAIIYPCNGTIFICWSKMNIEWECPPPPPFLQISLTLVLHLVQLQRSWKFARKLLNPEKRWLNIL